MSRIHVLVAVTSPDVAVEGIRDAIAARSDVSLMQDEIALAPDVERLLGTEPASQRCAVVFVSGAAEIEQWVPHWHAARADLSVLHMDLNTGLVRIVLRDPSLRLLLTALRELVERVWREPRERAVRSGWAADARDASGAPPRERPLLRAAIDWVHALLRNAVASVPYDRADPLVVSRDALLRSSDGKDEDDGDYGRHQAEADGALEHALGADEDGTDPLAVARRVLSMSPLDFRLLVLALAPELDRHHQRLIGFLLDDMSRRVGTSALYADLLGATPRECGELVHLGALTRWAAFEATASRPVAAGEPLRLDPFLVHWLLGERSSLTADPRVRRVLRCEPWPGADLLEGRAEQATAADLIAQSSEHGEPRWILLTGGDAADWRALIERGSIDREMTPLRVDAKRLTRIDPLEIEDCALRIARAARLEGGPLIVDLTDAEEGDEGDDRLRSFLAIVTDAGCRASLISAEPARAVRLLGAAPVQFIPGPPLGADARVDAVRVAARLAETRLSQDEAKAMASQYPLRIDGLAHAARLALQPLDRASGDPSLARFASACKEVAAESVSRLAERIEPVFRLEEVVLPPDRAKQLDEIVDNVRWAPRVLDEWKFGETLPYGRGVAALFCGASGTGKTMAAMGVARALGIQLLRLDLSRVVSKYIGDTEKNIDRVFADAQHSGAAILIDEADALLGKRSEVKDAHDRYANIEVAYLLQRMEAYEGLAILTTNLRQNLDPAFLRRLRFIVEFPRPDVDAREKIWRQCLPDARHSLDDADLRQLARRMEVTGGHIRQITVRAAFLAAAAGAQITLDHVGHAARAELAKLGMPPIEIGARRAA